MRYNQAKSTRTMTSTFENAICTAAGLTFRFDAPSPDDISFEDVASSLSKICRFTGHTKEFYSVAEHSCLVMQIVNDLMGGEAPREIQVAALLHDAPEAYVNDVSTPLKRMLPDYRAVEHRVWAAVAQKFGIPEELPKIVKVADKLAYIIERNQLMPARAAEIDKVTGFGIDLISPELCVVPLQPKQALKLFNRQAKRLGITS